MFGFMFMISHVVSGLMNMDKLSKMAKLIYICIKVIPLLKCPSHKPDHGYAFAQRCLSRVLLVIKSDNNQIIGCYFYSG